LIGIEAIKDKIRREPRWAGNSQERNDMKRKIVNIDESRCNGCGSCIPKCAEGALQIVNGKARIIKDTYCDGLGACLGECPQGAITITEREAEPFSENEVHEHLKKTSSATPPLNAQEETAAQKPQWPLKLNLVPVKAPFFENANLLLAADCTPFALKNFHSLMNGKRVIIGCPKFDDARAYAQKLAEIFRQNNIASATVIHMEVPCCTGLKWAVNKAIEQSSKKIPVKEYEVKIGGEIVEL
jgi:ferredoxin